jgi:5-hydroxyisourate hydrolase-like protein (transthyretin family)
LYFNKEIIDTSNLEKRTSQEIQLSIPVITKGISESKKKIHKVWEIILNILEHLHLPLLIIGTFLALGLLIARGNIADIIIFIFYLLIWAWEIYILLLADTAVVYVYDESNSEPLSLVVLRLIKEKNQAIIAVETTNKDGKAVFKMVERGIYKVEAAKAGYKVYNTEAQSIKSLKTLGRIKIGLKSKK